MARIRGAALAALVSVLLCAGQALALFRLDAEANPHSYHAPFAAGVALLQMGDREQAARNFEKALELNPKSYEAAQRLKEARRK